MNLPSEEFLEDPQVRAVEVHEAGKDHKSISKRLDICVSMVREKSYRCRKISTVAPLPRILTEVKRIPKVSR